METPVAAAPASRARYSVVGFAALLSIITYIDRVAIAQAAPIITDEFGLTKVQMGWVFSAFAIGYALFQIPGGWMGDRIGARRLLTAIVVWWSLFTAATGWAWNLATLAIVRFLFGVGQGGGFPAMTKALTVWLPREERTPAQGVMWLSARWGGAFAPLLMVWIMEFVSWRRAFEWLALIGAVWAAWFWFWYRDRPQEHCSTNAAELRLLDEHDSQASRAQGSVPWGRFLASRTVWMLWVWCFCQAYGWYFYITWLPTYLMQSREQTMAASALLAGMPLFFGGVGALVAGFSVKPLERGFGSAAARRIPAQIGMTIAGASLIVSVHAENPFWAMTALGFAGFGNDLSLPPSWGACMDVGGRYAGTLSGSMNTAGNLAGFIAPPTVAYILVLTSDDWSMIFYISAAVYFLGGAAWFGVDPLTPLDQAEQ